MHSLAGGGSGLNKMMQAQQQQDGGEKQQQKEYVLGGVTVSGSKYLDADLVLAVTNLTVGQKLHLPNDETIAKAIKSLWKQELFSNVSVTITKYIGDQVFLNIEIEERPRLSRFTFRNIKGIGSKGIENKVVSGNQQSGYRSNN